jgi:hypothetical protein
MENNCPAEPENESVPLDVGYAVKDMGVDIVLFAPVNTILGSAFAPMFGVITIFLSVSAIDSL